MLTASPPPDTKRRELLGSSLNLPPAQGWLSSQRSLPLPSLISFTHDSVAHCLLPQTWAGDRSFLLRLIIMLATVLSLLAGYALSLSFFERGSGFRARHRLWRIGSAPSIRFGFVKKERGPQFPLLFFTAPHSDNIGLCQLT